jgi:carboxypeptidase family protein
MSLSSFVRRYLLVGSVVLGLTTLFTVGTYGQGSATAVVGDVTDQQSRPITGAKVTVTDPSTGVTRETTTDAAGHYQFLSLQPGTYSVRVEAKGFRTSITDKVEALVSTTKTLNLQLEIGGVNETVEVSGEMIALVNTTDATLGNTFNSREILALPFEGRDAAGVLSLQPGVAFIPQTSNSAFVDTRNGALNGGRSDQANITLDGVDNNDQLLGTAFTGAVRSTLDSIEEFRVTTAGDNADQGRSSGGQVTLLTKGGTNTFHGSAYEQNRSRIGEANDWFNKHNQLNNGQPNTPGELVRNVFGGSLGGPIKKDRLFFFGTYEASRQNESVQENRNVPGLTLRSGSLSYPAANGNTVTLTSQQIASMDLNCGANGTCPLGNGPNPAAIAIFNKYPAPNANTCLNADGFNISCFSFSAPNPIHRNTSIAKLDYNVNRSGTHRVFLRGNYQTDSDARAPEFPGQPAANVIRDTSRALAVGYTAVLSNTLVNSFHYGFTRQSQGNQGVEKQPIVTFRFMDDLFPGTSSLNPTTSFTRNFHVPLHNWVDDVSWTKGRHTLQIGANLRLINNVRSSDATSFNAATINPLFLNTSPAGAPTGSGGSLDPSAQADGCSPAACPWSFPAVDPNNLGVYNNAIIDLTGIVTQVTGNYNRDKSGATLAAGAPVPRHFRAWEYEWYVQDVWHVKPNLTVTAGLRYTLLEPPYETTGTQAAPNINLNDFVNKRAEAAAKGQIYSPTFGFDLSGQANGKKPYWPYDYKDLGPRLSVAYSPNPSGGLLKALFGGAGKSSIRAGYGIVYDHFGEGIVDTFDQNGTFGLTTGITNPASVQTVDGGARFTGLNTIPVSSKDGLLLTPAPSGGFPATPPISTLATNTQQIAFGLDDKLKTPYSELVDLSFTRELPGGFVFEANYVGRFAHRLLQQRDLAMPVDLKDPKSGMDYFAAATMFSKDFYAQVPLSAVTPIPYWENLFPAAAGTCGAGTSATQCMYGLYQSNIGPGTFGETNAIFIFDAFCFPACLNQQPGQNPSASGQPGGPFQFYNPQYTALYAWSSIGKSSYNAGQFTLRSRPTHGVQFDFNYTFSKSLDVGSDAERVQTYGGLSQIVNTWSPFQLRSPSDFDSRHAITSTFVADLPFGKGKRFGNSSNRALDALIGGWEIAGITRWSSGLPFSVGNGGTFPTNFQISGLVINNGPKPATGTVAQGPNGDPSAFIQGGAAVADFRYAYPGESGQRNNFQGDGYFGVDAGVNKTIRITERQSLRLSAYAFNLTNSVRFDVANINANLQNQATFGLYSNTLTTSRRMEFAARFTF